MKLPAALYLAGKSQKLANASRHLYADTLKRDLLPAIDADFRSVLQGTGADEPGASS